MGYFQLKFAKICFFYQHSQPLSDVMQKDVENLEFVLSVNFEFIDSFERIGAKYLLVLAIHGRRLAIQKHLLLLQLLDELAEWVLFKLSTTCFLKAELDKTLSSRTRTMFLSSLPEMWCKSLQYV